MTIFEKPAGLARAHDNTDSKQPKSAGPADQPAAQPRTEAEKLADLGLASARSALFNARTAALCTQSLYRGETQLSAKGALRAKTGEHTGRSPKDKYVVRSPETENDVWWDNTAAMTRETFDRLHADFLNHASGKDLFIQELIGGADPAHQLNVSVVTELAWHSLFIRNLLIRPDCEALADLSTDLTIIDLPSFKADPARHGTRSDTVIALDLTRGIVLIGGTAYAGEMKKAVFTVFNHRLPERGVLPMHCSANAKADGSTTVFFGLSGTGKTTLSHDPERKLIGDDEHGWTGDGIFNFEGGCYAKTIRLSRKAEPEIFAATERFGTVLENVVLDEDGHPDCDDGSLTENARCAFAIDGMAHTEPSGRGGHPDNIVMLTADAFGVLPPVARLTPEQAMYHFLSGYTAKLAGTERGVTEPQATFSACFGAPFLPRHPSVYGDLLRDLIARHGVSCWLINTGWTGGRYGVGHRMPIQVTRRILAAALNGELERLVYRTDPNFGFQVPVAVPGVDTKILDPRLTWIDKQAYDRQAADLVDMFIKNFEKFEPHVDGMIRDASPRLMVAAE